MIGCLSERFRGIWPESQSIFTKYAICLAALVLGAAARIIYGNARTKTVVQFRSEHRRSYAHHFLVAAHRQESSARGLLHSLNGMPAFLKENLINQIARGTEIRLFT